MINNKNNFIKIFDWMYHLPVTGSEILLFGLLYSLVDERNMCRPSNSYLAKKMNCSDRSITTRLKHLKEKNLIQIVDIHSADNKSNRIITVMVEGCFEGRRMLLTNKNNNNIENNNKINNINKELTCTKHPSTPNEDIIEMFNDDLFMQYWNNRYNNLTKEDLMSIPMDSRIDLPEFQYFNRMKKIVLKKKNLI